jgi:hypothetical protein
MCFFCCSISLLQVVVFLEIIGLAAADYLGLGSGCVGVS